jgi:short subunit dehydrogenase-like uncharacterized protein
MAQALPRAYDLIVYGATGFTGRLVAEHLLDTFRLADLLRVIRHVGKVPNAEGR